MTHDQFVVERPFLRRWHLTPQTQRILTAAGRHV
jgi:hypothetical protein